MEGLNVNPPGGGCSRTSAGADPRGARVVVDAGGAVRLVSLRVLGAADPVFATATGSVDNRSNVPKRTVRKSARRVNVLMAESQLAPMREDVTIHDLRRVFSSLLDEVNAPRAYEGSSRWATGLTASRVPATDSSSASAISTAHRRARHHIQPVHQR